MAGKKNIRAEDLLMEDGFNDNLLEGEKKDGTEVAPEEIYLARQIFRFLKSFNLHVLSAPEKDHLKNRISRSVGKYKRKKQLIRWNIAAAIFVAGLSAAILYYRENSTPEIVHYARQLNIPEQINNTLLLLQNNHEVLIPDRNSEINYAGNGKKIHINHGQNINQKIDTKEIVYNTVIVPYGKRTRVRLSEGTTVWLNSGSRLVYPAVFPADKREVYLSGEAIFEVVRERQTPFLVNTDNFTVKVVGTVFNISAYSGDKYSSAVLERGKIELMGKRNLFTKENLTITPGIRAVYDPEQKSFRQEQVNPGDYLSWRNGYYIFHTEELGNILKKLSRYYDIEISIPDKSLALETFSGSLDLKKTLRDVLSVITETTPFTFHNEDGKLIIKSQ